MVARKTRNGKGRNAFYFRDKHVRMQAHATFDCIINKHRAQRDRGEYNIDENKRELYLRLHPVRSNEVGLTGSFLFLNLDTAVTARIADLSFDSRFAPSGCGDSLTIRGSIPLYQNSKSFPFIFQQRLFHRSKISVTNSFKSKCCHAHKTSFPMCFDCSHQTSVIIYVP